MSDNDSPWQVVSYVTLAPDLRRLVDGFKRAASASAASSSALMMSSWVRLTPEVPCLVGRIFIHRNLDNHILIQTSDLFYIDEYAEFALDRVGVSLGRAPEI